MQMTFCMNESIISLLLVHERKNITVIIDSGSQVVFFSSLNFSST